VKIQDQNIMKFAIALSLLAAMAEASPFYYWGYPYYYHPLKLGPKHEWVEGYGYAIPQAKAAEERKKREAVAEPEPAVLGSSSSAPLVYGAPLLGAPLGLPALTHGATVEHKGTEVTPGAVTVGEPVSLGYAVPLPLWGRKKREAEPEAEAEADPESWYYGYYGHGYGRYYGYGYGGYYGYPYGYYGYYG